MLVEHEVISGPTSDDAIRIEREAAELVEEIVEEVIGNRNIGGEGTRSVLMEHAGWDEVIPRPRRGSVRGMSEQELRRRRREAVVIHDGERPVGEEDVFMRTTL